MIDRKLRSLADAFIDRNAAAYREAGEELAECKGIERAQVSGLRGVAAAARRYVEIEDWLLGQIGRSSPGKKWRSKPVDAPRSIGDKLLEQLQAIRAESEKLAKEEQADWPKIAIALAQAWARRIEASFLYAKKPENAGAAQ
jgi:hypothetical protein